MLGGAGIILTMPSFFAAGTASALGDTGSQNTDLTPGLPAGTAAGDRLILQVGIRSSPTISCATPVGWDLLYEDIQAGGGVGQWLFGAAHGAAPPSVNWNSAESVNTAAIARIYAYRDVRVGATWFSAGGTASDVGATATVPSLTTPSAECLGLNFLAVSDDRAVASATGETGGDWVETVAEATTILGGDACLQAQHAEMAAAGTISGGTIALGASVVWVCRSLALRPLET